MCGIAGSLSWGKPDNPENIERMLKAIVYRGPDAAGVEISEQVILGHRRLSIIDLTGAANQPMWDHTRRFLITFNGEIYNYKEVRLLLEQNGAVFKTCGDTEVILEAWKQWGINALAHFVGMFAFAIWDSVEHILFLARDRMGEKPLYLTGFNRDFSRGVLFASELTALIKHSDVQREINFDAVVQYLATNYVFGRHSILKNVHKLAPAHLMIFKEDHAPETLCYWHLEDSINQKKAWPSEAEAQEVFKGLLQEAVAQQRQSDVPLGTFLSGGVDSSTITGALALGGPSSSLSTFSIGFSEKSFDESEQSKRVSRHFKTHHFTKIADISSMNTILKALNVTDEPFADSSIIPMHLLTQFAREHVTVCLSGDGADELFGGYETYIADKLFKSASSFFPRAGFSMIGSFLRRFWPVSYTKVSFDYKIKQFIEGCALRSLPKAHMFWRGIFNPDQIRTLLSDPEAASDKELDAFCYVYPFVKQVASAHYLDQAMYLDQKIWMPDDILVKVDRSAMAHSLEVRAPFLDHRIVEFAASLPVSWKIHRMQKKYFLKTSQRGIVPNSSLDQKKQGFSAPVSLWLKGLLRECARDVTSSVTLLPWFKPQAVQRLWQEHEEGRADHGLRLFGLLCLGLWMNRVKEA
ncbi:MAG: asparagine synthase (glutamine-hydrolyzing) [Holosporales bacterium]|jgi:asparagine synthase (glutamine-hydrolysing)|nr:asparagine synthase (glutamine-hydrolyzing) [Holosporales bacterium]